MSLKVALETLGFGPCYHMIEVIENPEQAKFWEAAWRGDPVDWDRFLGGYEAAVDWPVCAFYGELLQRHPGAKVILSVRGPERWYESTRKTIYELSVGIPASPLYRVGLAFVGLFVPGVLEIGRMDEIIWQGTFGGKFEDKHHAIEVFDRHNEEVRRRVPQDQLLVYEVKQGWGPLCEFLGVEEPDKPFPRLNDTAQMKRGIQAIRALSAIVPAALALAAALALVSLRRRTRP